MRVWGMKLDATAFGPKDISVSLSMTFPVVNRSIHSILTPAPGRKANNGDVAGKGGDKKKSVQVVDVRGADFAGERCDLMWCHVMWRGGTGKAQVVSRIHTGDPSFFVPHSILNPTQGASCPGPSTSPPTSSRRTQKWTVWWISSRSVRE